MNQASVGVHCPSCVAGNKQKVYTRDSLPGARGLVTQALIALNVAAFVAQVVFFDARAGSDGSTAEQLAVNGPFIAELGEWWRIFTSGFLHFGVFHLGMNMYSLYVIGPMIEKRLGPVRFALAYMASLVGGSFGALLVEPRALTMGASGAIFGLLGLLIFMLRSRGISIGQSGLGQVLLLNLFITLSGYVSLGGHAGGFIVGAALGAMYFGISPGAQPIFGRDQVKPDIATAAAIAVLIVGCLWAASIWANPIF
jgi:membrane associated rhomboid family serine protease